MTTPSQPNNELDKAIALCNSTLDENHCCCQSWRTIRIAKYAIEDAAKRSKELEKENAELEVKLQDQYHINDQLLLAAKRSKELEKENELLKEAQRQNGCCDTCGYCAWSEPDLNKVEHCLYCQLRTELKQRAEALRVADNAFHGSPSGQAMINKAISLPAVQNALKSLPKH